MKNNKKFRRNNNINNNNKRKRQHIVHIGPRPVQTQFNSRVEYQTIDYYTQIYFNNKYKFTGGSTVLDIQDILSDSTEYSLLSYKGELERIVRIQLDICCRGNLNKILYPGKIYMYANLHTITDSEARNNAQYPTIYFNDAKTYRYRFPVRDWMMTVGYRGFQQWNSPAPLCIGLTTEKELVDVVMDEIASVRVGIVIAYKKLDKSGNMMVNKIKIDKWKDRAGALGDESDSELDDQYDFMIKDEDKKQDKKDEVKCIEVKEDEELNNNINKEVDKVEEDKEEQREKLKWAIDRLTKKLESL